MNDTATILDAERMKDPIHAAQGMRLPRLISFSGIDGAGKSTQIESLSAAMRQAGVPFRIVRFWDEVAALVRFRETASISVFKSDAGVGMPGAPVNRRDKNVHSWYMTCVRLFLYTLDTFSLRAVVARASPPDSEVVIFDRYIYDELANLNLKNPAIRFYLRLILSLVPRPDISYLLDADPVQARARKPEYPLEFLYVNREAYLTLSRLVGGIIVIDPLPVEEVKAEIMKHAAGMFSRKERQYVA